jgi:hypothetical protein
MGMNKSKKHLMLLILAGGLTVLGSYAMVFQANPDTIRSMWGGVPGNILTIYQVNMLWGTLGYFAFTYYFLFHRGAESTRFSNSFQVKVLLAAYSLILFPSAAWTPLTLQMINEPSNLTWFLIRLVLGLVAAGSLMLLYLLVRTKPSRPGLVYMLALVGAIGFNLQTVVLDALLWPAFFP